MRNTTARPLASHMVAVVDFRPLLARERLALELRGKRSIGMALLTLECGHHVIRSNPKFTGSRHTHCRLCFPDDGRRSAAALP